MIVAALSFWTFAAIDADNSGPKAQAGPWESVGPSGGAIGALAVHPTQTDLMVAVADTYPFGVYKSTDAGQSWKLVYNLKSPYFYDAAIDPFDPATIHLLLDRGLYSSNDGGTTWTFRPFPERFRGMGRLLADQANPGVLWASASQYLDPPLNGTAMAVLKSADEGATWTGTSLASISYESRTECLAQDPSNPQVLYAGGSTCDATGSSARICQSSDGGATWAAIVAPETYYVYSMVVDPADSRRLLAGTDEGVFLSLDGGASWQNVIASVIVWRMAFDSTDSQVVYAGANDGLYKSTDRGTTWQAGPAGLIKGGCTGLIAVSPGQLFVSSWAGIRFSADAGAIWADRMNGIWAKAVTGVGVAPSSPNIVYFGARYGEFYRSMDFGETVTPLPFPQPQAVISKIALNPYDADDVFVQGTGLLRSRDGGRTWVTLLTKCSDFVLGRSNVNHVFATAAVTQDNGDHVMVTFFKSLDGGASWEFRPIIDNAPAAVWATAVAVDGAGDETFYLGANYADWDGPLRGGLVFKSIDGGATWAEIVRWAENHVLDITADPTTSGLLYLAAEIGLYKSQDGGASWRKTEQMNGAFVRDFEFHPVDPREIWLGTSNDAYFSQDRGESWDRTFGWDYRAGVTQLDFSPDGNFLYAGTENMGAYRMRRSGAIFSAQISGMISTPEGAPIPGVILSLSNNPGTAITDASGRYSLTVPTGWSGTLIPSANGWTFNPPNRFFNQLWADAAGQDFAGAPAPTIGLSHTRLNFGAVVGGERTPAQSLRVFNAGAGSLNWTAAADAPWLGISPAVGTDVRTVAVAVDPAGLLAGSYFGDLVFAAAGASNSPQRVEVRLDVIGASSDEAPFGYLDTPADGSPAAGSVAVTGWALDDVEVKRVEIKREPTAGDAGSLVGPDGLVFVGNAVFVPGARPDVAAANPDAPWNDRAGWGYMLLTNMLPNRGNGTFVIHAVAFDVAGHATRLGRTTLHCDNANAVAPFGTIDTPVQGGPAAGPAFVNFGWVLTPFPKEMPRDGSTIWVFVDSVPLGHPVYNLYRQDVFDLFPGYLNRDGAVGYFVLDTTKYADGMHTIAWGVADNAGVRSGIGSRFFTIQNGGSGAGEGRIQRLQPDLRPAWTLELVSPGEIRVEEIEPAEAVFRAPSGMKVVGWGETMGRDLPVGSTLDPESGLFAWIPGPGFLGRHVLHFAATDGTRVGLPTEIVITIVPRDYIRAMNERPERVRK